MFVDHTATFAMPTPAGALCFVCGTKSVRYAGDACSRRCDWLHRGCCPQCGRGRHSNGTFCGPQCAGESIHANWCGACGVRQLNHGSASCGVPHCEAAMHSMIARNVPTYVPHHHHQQHPAPHGYTIHHGIQAPPQLPTRIGAGPSPYHHPNHHRAAVPVVIPPRNRGFVPHSNLAPNDKLVASLRHQLPSSSELLGAIKVGGPAEDRKRYVANRNRLETELNEWCGIGAPKYGHGGEGNEHRRILSLRSECGSRCLDGKHCGSLSCEVCVVLDGGLRREAVGRNVFTTWHSARDVLASPVTTEDCSNVEGVRVLMVCRVAVGHPAIAEGPEAANEMLCSPCPPEGAHTVVVRRRSDAGTSTNPTVVAPSVETVEVFDDAGIDPLVLLIVSHHQ